MRRILSLTAVVATIAIIALACAVAFRSNREAPLLSHAIGRGVSHDLGTVEITSPEATERTIQTWLKNDLDTDVRFVNGATSCGCAGITYPEFVAAGEQFCIETSVRLQNSGRRNVTAALQVENGGTIDFSITINAVRRREMTVMPGGVVLRPGQPRAISVVATDFDGSTPAAPGADEGAIDLHFDGWSQIETADAELGRPARWIGNLVLTLPMEAHEACPSQFMLRLSEYPAVPISVVVDRHQMSEEY